YESYLYKESQKYRDFAQFLITLFLWRQFWSYLQRYSYSYAFIAHIWRKPVIRAAGHEAGLPPQELPDKD
ncbi:MAG: hypothetical protein ACREAY_01710, partial [Nitrososphaera sp.]|uniref:hypothetical protein n=1 Tax=Nitrososphaera sp. TaxID=1971748 RepID=UPI003D6EEFB0